MISDTFVVFMYICSMSITHMIEQKVKYSSNNSNCNNCHCDIPSIYSTKASKMSSCIVALEVYMKKMAAFKHYSSLTIVQYSFIIVRCVVSIA